MCARAHDLLLCVCGFNFDVSLLKVLTTELQSSENFETALGASHGSLTHTTGWLKNVCPLFRSSRQRRRRLVNTFRSTDLLIFVVCV